MREKGKLLKVFAICCFAFLFLGVISAVCLQALGQEKKTKEKTDIKSEQAKSNPATQQTSKESEEDIKPPEGEQWAAPGDEKLYRFDINPITPNEGITGGILIYLGHYVRPPYKVEARDIIKDGKFVEVEGKINGIQITPIPSSIKEKFYKKEIKPVIVLAEEEKECYRKKDIFITNIENDVIQIGKRIGLKKSNIGKIEEQIRAYLKSRPEIVSFEMDSIWGALITYKICNEYTLDLIFNWKDNSSDTNESTNWEEGYKKGLNHFNSVSYIWFDVEEYDNQEDITKIAFILSSNKSMEEKIKQIYQITMNIKYAKLLYYNFEFNQYIKDKRMGLVK